MYLNFKGSLAGILIFFGCCIAVFGQGDEGMQNKIYVRLKPSFTVPLAFGDNFLGKAYNLKPGFLGEAQVFFPNRMYLGIQGNFFKADVADITAVGDYDRANIWHNYFTGGYALLPKESDFGIDAGLGFGYAIYANRRQNIDFHDDGFSAMANIDMSYRFSRVLGAGIGVQFAKDFLATETAPELESFFKNTSILYISVGLVFYINQ